MDRRSARIAPSSWNASTCGHARPACARRAFPAATSRSWCGREVPGEPKGLLGAQPTRGVDIGAIEFIHRELLRSRDQGCAVLVISVELDEILALADRILVMFAGRIVGEVPAVRAAGAAPRRGVGRAG